MNVVEIDASDLSYRDLNGILREQMVGGADKILLRNVNGQKFIGTRLYLPDTANNKRHDLEIDIYGTPGNDLGAFLHGHKITVHANAQDGVGNTMGGGEIVVEGRAGDVVGMSMRGGKIFIRDGVGYRAAMHMKEYEEMVPVLVIGGAAQDFLGEYMAGGIVILLGVEQDANFIGTGMHGGAIYIRAHVGAHQLGKEVGVQELDDRNRAVLERYVKEFAEHFPEVDAENILEDEFLKLVPVSKRPYEAVYAH